MASASLIFAALFWLTIFSLQHNSVIAQSVAQSDSLLSTSSSILFATDLLPLIAEEKSAENIVYSPVSIYTLLAFAYLGAEGSTADEIRKVLMLNQEEKLNFASKYGHFLRTTFEKTKADGNAPQLKMANRLFVDNKIKILPEFNKISRENFDSQVENVDFSQHSKAAEKINRWVAEQTEHKIKNLMQPEGIDQYTIAVLLNAIYFKAKWLSPFSTHSTFKSDFHISRNKSIKVDTMNTDGYFHYVELPELNATALKLPYENSDISMMIILPNEDSDLQSLEKQLVGMNLNSIIAKMKWKYVYVSLPKFHLEFELDLKEPLRKMGCSTMFGDKANFSSIFDASVPVRVSDIKHKAYLGCNEAGSEATATGFMLYGFKSIIFDAKVFQASRPFFFAIHNEAAVFFAGHVAKF